LHKSADVGVADIQCLLRDDWRGKNKRAARQP
jgi:hypothetical protein